MNGFVCGVCVKKANFAFYFCCCCCLLLVVVVGYSCCYIFSFFLLHSSSSCCCFVDRNINFWFLFIRIKIRFSTTAILLLEYGTVTMRHTALFHRLYRRPCFKRSATVAFSSTSVSVSSVSLIQQLYDSLKVIPDVTTSINDPSTCPHLSK